MGDPVAAIMGAIGTALTAIVVVAVIIAMAPALFKAQAQYDHAVDSTSTGNSLVDFVKDNELPIGIGGAITFLVGIGVAAIKSSGE